VEEAVLSAEQATVQFADVETSQATLSVVGFQAENDANNHHFAAFDVDVATVTHKLLDALEPAPMYQAELVIPIATNDSGGDETNVVCTVTLSVSYTPSAKDQMEKLYDLMEKETSAKAAAREELRRASLDLHALQGGGSGSSGTTVATKPAVSAGFLNKGSSKAPPPKPSAWKVWYQRASVIVPMVKNYVFFVGFIVVSQYYGSNLAIPAPV
jgi:hypothetical protein